MYKLIIRPLLFLLSPEKAHYLTFSMVKMITALPFARDIIRAMYVVKDPKLERQVFGLTFKNPVGLAAGFDKNASHYNDLASFGFSFIEIGTITPKAQDGNPKPRLFRLSIDNALINRMGFNNVGADQAIDNLKKRHTKIVIGGNIGKNKVTPNDDAVSDYLKCFDKLFDYVDYFVVNVSSPNTPGLRELQDGKFLTEILGKLQIENRKRSRPKPVLLKIAPDLSWEQIDEIIEIAGKTELDGLIATNTTISREGLSVSDERLSEIGAGGLSGKPLTRRSTEIIEYISRKTNRTIPIIGVGGIHSAEDAMEKIEAGATLVQLYTGFIYEGPALVKKINQKLLKKNQ